MTVHSSTSRALALALASSLAACGGEDLGASESGRTRDDTGSGETGESGSADASESSASASETETEPETETETGEPACDPTMPELVEQDFLRRGEGEDGVELSACDNHVWWVAAAAGTQLTIAIDSTAAVEVAISYPDEPSFLQPITADTFHLPGGLAFDSPRSGEFAVLVRPVNPGDDPELTLSYDIAVSCTNECGLETTRFPIVMVHGWTGFENIGPLGYYYGVREDLEDLGYPLAIAVLDPYNSVDVRGEQLLAFAEATLQNQRARKINLFGHSQGGIDSRYVASPAGGALGAQVGAVITLGTPHQGTPFTDIALGLIPGPTEQVLIFLLNFLGAAQDQQSDVEASLYTLSETFMQGEFNQIYVDDPEVEYLSWMGETCPGGLGCLDAVDLLLLFSYELIADVAGPNDGLVPESSAIWGEYLGLIPADHIDQIGQIAGVTGLNYDHVEFFRDNARMLRDRGH